MTAEDEEFNRIEMESRIKQEYVRAMRKKVGDDFDAEYAKTMTGLMDELALARVLIRELGDRLAKLEKTEPVKMVEYICVCGKGMKFESKDGIVAPQRTWVGLTRAERFEIEKAMSKYYDYQHECKTVCLPEFAAAIEAKLKEKNT